MVKRSCERQPKAGDVNASHAIVLDTVGQFLGHVRGHGHLHAVWVRRRVGADRCRAAAEQGHRAPGVAAPGVARSLDIVFIL